MNLCSRNSPYSLNCHVGSMLVFRKLCRITQSSDVLRTESVTAMDHEQTMGVNSKVLDQKHRTTLSRSLCRASQSVLCLTYLNNLVSSANFKILLEIPWSKSLIKTRNKTNTEPCGTQLQTSIHPNHLPLILTRCLLSFNQSSITFSILPLIPCFFNFCTLS